VTFFLFAAAFVGGALNAVAGGGSFIGLPALIYAGVPAVSANATNTLALWPASISSAWAYRRELAAARSWVTSLGVVSLAGGILGGLVLGLTLVAFLEYRDSSFKSEEEVLRVLSLPVLALVPVIGTPEPARGSRGRRVKT